MSDTDYGKPSEPGWYFIEIDGVAKPRRVGRLNDGRIYCPDVAMANGATVRYGPRIPEDWGECWDLVRAQELRRQAEATCARRTSERDEAIRALVLLLDGAGGTASEVGDRILNELRRWRADDVVQLHHKISTDRQTAAMATLPSFTPDDVEKAMREGTALSDLLMGASARVREFAIRNAQQSADMRQQPVRCEVEADVNGERSSILIGIVHHGDPCDHCGAGYRRNGKGEALEPGEDFACSCCEGRGYVGGGLIVG